MTWRKTEENRLILRKLNPNLLQQWLQHGTHGPHAQKSCRWGRGKAKRPVKRGSNGRAELCLTQKFPDIHRYFGECSSMLSVSSSVTPSGPMALVDPRSRLVVKRALACRSQAEWRETLDLRNRCHLIAAHDFRRPARVLPKPSLRPTQPRRQREWIEAVAAQHDAREPASVLPQRQSAIHGDATVDLIPAVFPSEKITQQRIHLIIRR